MVVATNSTHAKVVLTHSGGTTNSTWFHAVASCALSAQLVLLYMKGAEKNLEEKFGKICFCLQ